MQVTRLLAIGLFQTCFMFGLLLASAVAIQFN